MKKINNYSKLNSIEKTEYRLEKLYNLSLKELSSHISASISKEPLRWVADIDKQIICPSSSINTIVDFFSNILFNILNISNPHINFLPIKTSRGFFNETHFINISESNKLSARISFCALLNHCIIHTLYLLLAEENNKNEPLNLSYSNECSLRTGYFKSDNLSKQINELAQNLKIHEEYEKNLNFYSSPPNFDTPYYDAKDRITPGLMLNLFENLGINRKSDDTVTYTTPTYLKNFAFLVYRNAKFNKLNIKTNKNQKTLYSYYKSLHEEIDYTLNNPYSDYITPGNIRLYLTQNNDKLLFNIPLEYYYGFNLTTSLENFYNSIYNTSSLIGNKIADFSPKIPINNCIALYESPLLFTRSYYFYYAYNIAVRTKTFQSTYNKHKIEKGIQKISPIYFLGDVKYNSSPDTLETYAPKNIKDFLLYINHITVPFLEDIWDFYIYNIIKKLNINSSQLLNIISRYLNEYYDIITSDLSCFFNLYSMDNVYIDEAYILNNYKNIDASFMEKLCELLCKYDNNKAKKSDFKTDKVAFHKIIRASLTNKANSSYPTKDDKYYINLIDIVENTTRDTLLNILKRERNKHFK